MLQTSRLDEIRKHAECLSTSLNLSFLLRTRHTRACPVANIHTYSDVLRRPHVANNQTHRHALLPCCPVTNVIARHRRDSCLMAPPSLERVQPEGLHNFRSTKAVFFTFANPFPILAITTLLRKGLSKHFLLFYPKISV